MMRFLFFSLQFLTICFIISIVSNCDVGTSHISRVFGISLPPSTCTVVPSESSIATKPKCPVQYFSFPGFSECHPWLTCTDLPTIHVQELIGHGAVKAVYRATWNGIDVAYNVLNNPSFESDFLHGLDMLKLLNPNPLVVQLVGYCLEENVIITEYHKLGGADKISDILYSKKQGSLLNRLGLCLNYVQILNYLHNSSIGTLVFCDSNDLFKLLSQLLVTEKLALVLNDLDALALVNKENNFSIKCGHRQLTGKFVAPEQLWFFDEPYLDVNMPGYDEKSDIWKNAAVCSHFLGDSVKTNVIVHYNILALHEKCRRLVPCERPSASSLEKEYLSIIELFFQ